MADKVQFLNALKGAYMDPAAAADRYAAQQAQQGAAQKAAAQAAATLAANNGRPGASAAPPPSNNVSPATPPAPLGPPSPSSPQLAALNRLAGRQPSNPIQQGGNTQADIKGYAGKMAAEDLDTLTSMKQPQPDDFGFDPNKPDAAQDQLDQANQAYQRGQQLNSNKDLKQQFIDQQTLKYMDSMNRGEWPQR